jgi:predicted ATPase
MDRADADALFEGLEEAQRAGFIASGSGSDASFAFTHELVRQTVLAGISQPRRQMLHAKIANALENLYRDQVEEKAAEIALHLVTGGSFIIPEKAAHYLLLTGQNLLKAGALEDARLALTNGLSYQTDAATRAQILGNLASTERGLGEWSPALAHLKDSIEIYAGLGDLKSIGRTVFEIVEALIWSGQFDEAIEVAESGLGYLRADEGAYRARLLAVKIVLHSVICTLDSFHGSKSEGPLSQQPCSDRAPLTSLDRS